MAVFTWRRWVAIAVLVMLSTLGEASHEMRHMDIIRYKPAKSASKKSQKVVKEVSFSKRNKHDLVKSSKTLAKELEAKEAALAKALAAAKATELAKEKEISGHKSTAQELQQKLDQAKVIRQIHCALAVLLEKMLQIKTSVVSQARTPKEAASLS
eukprot:1184047-Prorocentrum_minimum.AAC.4